MHLQRIAVVAWHRGRPRRNVNVRQKVHLYLIHAVTLAGLAASSLHVKAEATGLIAAQLSLVGLAEQLADKIKDAGIGCGIGARCASDWDWSMLITLSVYSMPSMLSCSEARKRAPLSLAAREL